jgi:hypothetical protein
VHAWQAAAPPTAGCQPAGQVSGLDPLEHAITLKSDAGHYSDVRYDDSTTFINGKVILAPDEVNIDDRLCVEAFRAGKPEVASRVRVTRRPEIDARDKQELIRWQSEGLFGAVKSFEARDHTIIVSVSGSPDVLVDAAGPVMFWSLPAGADDPADVIRGDWESLVVGDPIYIRGDRISGAQTMRARLIVSGGLHSFAGSIETMQPLTSLLLLRDFRSGRSRPVHFDFIPIYVVGKTTASGAEDRHLFPATIGDLKEGDSVLILGRENNQTGRIDAFLLITGFSPGGVLEPGATQSADWIFDAVGFGGRRP